MEGFKENISIIVILCFSSLFHCVTWYISEISAEICPAINNLIPINVTAFHLFAFLSVIFAWNCFYLYPCTKYSDIWLWIEASVSFFLYFFWAYLLYLSRSLLLKALNLWWKNYAPCSYLKCKQNAALKTLLPPRNLKPKSVSESKEKKVNIYICIFTKHREAFRIRMNIMLNYHHRETIRTFNGFFLIEITEVIYFCLSQATENKPTQLTELPPRGERADPHPYSPEKVSSFVGKMTWLPSLLFWF